MTKAQEVYKVFRPYMTKELARYATIRLLEIKAGEKCKIMSDGTGLTKGTRVMVHWDEPPG